MARLTRVRPLEELEERIGVRIPDRGRLERALTHSSFRSDKGKGRSYERLEFLGDRVLGLVIADKLFEMFPDAEEGELSLRLNALVNAETCAAVADEIGLYDFVRQGGDLKRLAPSRTRSIRADLMESLIAAIYLSAGIEAARAFIESRWGHRLNESVEARRDPKTALQEWAHQRGPETPNYEVIDRSGPDHNPSFTIRVHVDGVEPSEGEGRSKRLAEQAAATAMLIREKVWKDEGS